MKRFCYLKDFQLFYFKEANSPDTETLVCDLSLSDVYTITKTHPKSPTAFCFAVKSFGPDQECKFFCVEKADRLFDWVLALRLAKVI
jgi:PH domain